MKIFTTIICSILLGINAIGQTPAITATSAKAAGSAISFDISAVEANTTIQIDFGDGVKVDKVIGYNSIPVNGTLGSSQTLKIYGSGISYLSCAAQELTALDVSNCNTLESLYVQVNDLTTLDVTKNSALKHLSSHSNDHLHSLDLTKNKALKSLTCYFNNLTSIDLTQNTELTYLSIGINKLKTLDVSKNTKLEKFYSSNNDLSQLDISANPLITQLSCSNNRLTFSQIPLNKATYTYYEYAPQKAINITKKVVVGTELDLSSEYSIGGKTTTYTWKTKTSGTALIAGVDYTITSGKTTFLKPQADSAYCEMTNASFPELTSQKALKTTNILITATPKKNQTITFDPISAKKLGDDAFDLKATSTSNLDVSFSSNNTDIISITGTKVTILKAGTVTITASQSGNGDWNAAESVTQTLTISKKTQTINFEAIPAKKIKDAPFTLKASSSSNLPITFTSSDPLLASVNGSTVTIHKAGTVTFTATQAGNEECEPISASQKLTISSTTGINDEKEDMLSIYPNPVTENLYIKGKEFENTNASIFNALGTNVWSGKVAGQTINVSQLPTGIYLLRIGTKNEVKTIRFEKQ